MKQIKTFLLIILVCLSSTQLAAQQTASDPFETALGAIFNNIVIPSDAEYANRDLIKPTFGAQGIGLSSKTVSYIRTFYYALDMITRFEVAARIAALAQEPSVNILNDSIHLADALQDLKGWGPLVIKVAQKVGIVASNAKQALANPTLKKRLTTVVPDFASLSYVLGDPNVKRYQIADSITVSPEDIATSLFWQNYLKFQIAATFDNDENFLYRVEVKEELLFNLLPNFEIAYYTTDFTNLRNATDILRISTILNTKMRNRLLAHCTEWRNDFAQKKLTLPIPPKTTSNLAITNWHQEQDTALAQAFNLKELLSPQKTQKKKIVQKVTNPQTEIDSSQAVLFSSWKTVVDPKAIAQGQKTHSLNPATEISLTNAQKINPRVQAGQRINVVPTVGETVTVYTSGLPAFKQTMFYQAAKAAQNIHSVGPFSPWVHKADGSLDIRQVPALNPYPYLREQMRCFSMLISLQRLIQDEVGTSTTKQQQMLVAISQPEEKNVFPLFLFSRLNDYLYLADIMEVKGQYDQNGNLKTESHHAYIPQNSSTISGSTGYRSTQQTDNEAVKVAGFFDDVGDFFKGVGADIEDFGSAAWSSVENLGKSIGLETASLGVGIAAGLSGDSSLKNLSNKFKREAATSLKQAKSSLDATLNALGKTVSDTLDGGVGILVSNTLGRIPVVGSALSQDIQGVWDSTVDFAVDTAITPLKATVAAGDGLLKLTYDTVEIVANSMSDLVGLAVYGVSGGAAGSKPAAIESDLWGGIKEMGHDIIVAVLSTASATISTLAAEFKDLLRICAYMISTLVDTILVITTLGKWAVQGGSFQSNFAEMEMHRHVISQIVTQAAIIAVSVALAPETGGVSLAMMVGMGALFVAGGEQADEMWAQREERQSEHIVDATFQTVVQEITTNQNMRFTAQELERKLSADIANYERGAGFHEHLLDQMIAGNKDFLATILGQHQSVLLQRDPSTQSRGADVGSPYGFETNWLNLNPSLGLTVYTDARQTVAQEIAVSPRALSTTNQTETAFWFNQRVVKQLASATGTTIGQIIKTEAQLQQPPLSVEVRLRAVYVLDTYHLGLYLGGNQLNEQQINAYNADIDQAHLAKMIVFNKAEKNQSPQLGIYEHEGKGWITNNLSGPSFEVGTWYHIKATLNGTRLTVAVFKEGEPAGSQQTFEVNTTDQSLVGIIYSGASLEFELLEPKSGPQQVTDVKTFKPLSNRGQSYGNQEQYREQVNFFTYRTFMNPTTPFTVPENKGYQDVPLPIKSPFNLTAISLESVVRGHYIYTTSDTPFAKTYKQTDYVVMATTNQNDNSLTGYGMPPSENNSAVASLITGEVYNITNGNKLSEVDGLFAQYTQSYLPSRTLPSLDPSLTQKIQATQKNYMKALAKPQHVTLGIFNLDSVSAAFKEGIYVYQTQKLYSPQGAPLKDENGKPLRDYIMLAEIEDDQPVSIGGRYKEGTALNGFVSLITQQIYSQNAATPLTTIFGTPVQLPADPLTTYNITSKLPTLSTAIKQLRTTYQAALTRAQKAAQPAEPQPIALGVPATPGPQASDQSLKKQSLFAGLFGL